MICIDNKFLSQDLSSFPVFFFPEWLQYCVAEGGRFIYIKLDSDVWIPLIIRRHKFTSSVTLAYKPFNPNGAISPEQENFYLQELINFIRVKKLGDVVLPPIHVCNFSRPLAISDSKRLGIISIQLNKSTEDLFSAFSKTYRTQIRACERDGFTVSFSQDYFKFFFENYRINQNKYGKYPGRETDIYKLLQALPNNSRLLTVLNANGEPEGSILLLFDAFRGYYLIGAKAEERNTHQGAQKFLQWKAILFSKQRGCNHYNFGGYRYELTETDKFYSIQEFKLKFGAFIEDGYHFTHKINLRYDVYQSLIRLRSLLR